jgi:hypothetical protein
MNRRDLGHPGLAKGHLMDTVVAIVDRRRPRRLDNHSTEADDVGAAAQLFQDLVDEQTGIGRHALGQAC